MAKIRGNTQILAASITNTEIATNAAIAYSKLNLAISIVNADIATNAAIAWSKLNPSYGTPGSILPDDAVAEGSGTLASRNDHTHGIVAAVGDALGGTAGSEGSATSFARADHGHIAFDTTNPSTQAFSDSPVVGAAAVASRRDHKHGMPASPGGAGNFDITRETPGGTINGTNTAFTLATAPSPAASELVFLNGVLLDAVATATDMSQYAISGTAITMGAAPVSGDSMKSCYGT